VKQVGRELGVRYVLEGSVRKSGNRLRITGQLIDASTGTHLWADRFDGEIKDIFELQDQITASVVSTIAPKLEHPVERIRLDVGEGPAHGGAGVGLAGTVATPLAQACALARRPGTHG
jgi:hypothetical protein